MYDDRLYKDYFDIDENYFPAVNEELINSGDVDWRRFYPHDTFVQLLKDTADVLRRKQKLSIWVEGAYGTGKSHAALTLKCILDANENVVKKYFEDNKLDMDLFNIIQGAKNQGTVLTVHRYGSSNIRGDELLLIAVQESIKKSLVERGIEFTCEESLKDSIVRKLGDPVFAGYFDNLIEERYQFEFGEDRTESIVNKLLTYDEKDISNLIKKVIIVAQKEGINAFKLEPENLIKWIQDIIIKNNLKSIIFIWDEFTEYFLNNRNALTGFQKLADASQYMPFNFVIVSHKSEGLFNEKDNDRTKILGRFIRPTCEIKLPENMAFKLMGAAMRKKDDEVIKKEWEEVSNDLQGILSDSSALVMKSANIDITDLKGILPIHPYAAIILKHLSSLFSANQRSMFEFIKNKREDENDRSFQWFIDNFGPMSEDNLLTIDKLWEYFYADGKANLESGIKSLLSVYEQNENAQRLDKQSRKVLKTILLLQGISETNMGSVELFRPTVKNIGNAYEGTELNGIGAVQIAERLVKDGILYKQTVGNNKEIQFVAMRAGGSEADLNPIIEELRKNKKLKEIVDEYNINNFMGLTGALKLRYEVKSATVDCITRIAGEIRNKHWENKLPLVICYAKDEAERAALIGRIRELANSDEQEIIWIDTSLCDMSDESLEEYYYNLAECSHWRGKDTKLSDQYERNAKEVIDKWQKNLENADIRIITKNREEKVFGANEAGIKLKEINAQRFTLAVDKLTVLTTMFEGNPSYKLGAKCGVSEEVIHMYKSAKIQDKMDGVWKIKDYWVSNKNHCISKIKIFVDKLIEESFEKKGEISIREVFNNLKQAPYGFIPCNLTAFVLGFLLKEYAVNTYNWSNKSINEPMSVDKLAEMIEEIIKLEITPNNRYVDKYIVKMSSEERKFLESTSIIFNIPISQCASVEKTINEVIGKIRILGFPLWAIGEYIRNENPPFVDELLKIIEKYCYLANKKGATYIASEIGKVFMKREKLIDDMHLFITKENCKQGMNLYLESYKNGRLKELAEKIGDNGNFLIALKNKATSDSSWLWEKETINSKIDDLILDYQLIDASNLCVQKTNNFDELVKAWLDKVHFIKLSYEGIKNDVGSLKELLTYINDIAINHTIRDSIKQKFLDELVAHHEAFSSFCNNQVNIFKEKCQFSLNGLNDTDIENIFKLVPADSFLKSNSEYQNKANELINEYKKSLKSNEMLDLWFSKTGTKNPKEWSAKNQTPILCMVEKDFDIVKSVFDTIGRKNATNNEIEKSIEYLKASTSLLERLSDKGQIDNCFKDKLIGSYSVILTDLESVRSELKDRLTCEIYDWYPNPQMQNVLKLYAEDVYRRNGFEKALKKIENMEADSLKSYLKELVKENINVGIEIIKEQ